MGSGEIIPDKDREKEDTTGRFADKFENKNLYGIFFLEEQKSVPDNESFQKENTILLIVSDLNTNNA